MFRSGVLKVLPGETAGTAHRVTFCNLRSRQPRSRLESLQS